eukprot:CAMPEP_0204611352 /NCGR_PEP_ID=MMETSP0661-20131031/61979_1 /ASSEMBLY_ACC=CAM_ASM_000606 /TAXON_ID=109239 /ORGANISM="Alexandrium margalefi, Strain AMGDE01CS-322" /LENGTH=268 /DNA_ID=CAMNT_0051623197 /DNA_START=80 /DNA_END=884 /DNA_ORIENTATION=-
MSKTSIAFTATATLAGLSTSKAFAPTGGGTRAAPQSPHQKVSIASEVLPNSVVDSELPVSAGPGLGFGLAVVGSAAVAAAAFRRDAPSTVQGKRSRRNMVSMRSFENERGVLAQAVWRIIVLRAFLDCKVGRSFTGPYHMVMSKTTIAFTATATFAGLSTSKAFVPTGGGTRAAPQSLHQKAAIASEVLPNSVVDSEVPVSAGPGLGIGLAVVGSAAVAAAAFRRDAPSTVQGKRSRRNMVSMRSFENERGVQAPPGFWDPAGFAANY